MNSRVVCLPVWIYLLCLFLIGCASSPPAPVIERAPTPSKKPPVVAPASKPVLSETPAEKDWRPDTYTVKKGDTLISIGLEFGYDYKDIAQKNDIQPPYVIHVGQVLKLQQLKSTKEPMAVTEDMGGVVVSPLKTEPTIAPPTAGKPAVASEIPLLNEPKALREPYSEQALAAPVMPPKPVKTAELAKPSDTAKPPETAKTETSKTESAAGDDEAMEWAWPVQGKVLAGFNESASAKGIDIEGTMGQAVAVAAPGKVIYSGSDLRGYGKLVIVKHNKTYLSVYAHNSKILVKEGQQVSKGQKIAEMGSTDSDRVKLHFEIRRQGKSVDPAKYLASSPN